MGNQPRLLRPANYPAGRGRALACYIGTNRNGVPYAVMNLQGRAQMANIDCPFRKADEILGSLDPAIRDPFRRLSCRTHQRKGRDGLAS